MKDIEARLRQPWPQETAFSGRPMAGLVDPVLIDVGPKRRGWRWSMVRLLAGATASAALIVALVIAIDSQRPSRPAIGGPADAARAMDVPTSAIVQTGDGYVAARLGGGVVTLLLAQPREDGGFAVRRLALLDASIAKQGASWVAGNTVECSADWGLTWSRFIFGATNQPVIAGPAAIDVVGMAGRASMIANDQAFVVAFAPDVPNGNVQVQFPSLDGSLTLVGGTFPTANRCGAAVLR